MTASRAELLQFLSILSEAAPELRFGQMVSNLATLARGAEVEAIWDAEDDELVVASQRLVEHYQDRAVHGVALRNATGRQQESS